MGNGAAMTSSYEALAVATRQTSRSAPRASRLERLESIIAQPSPASSRKRPASALADDATGDADADADARPPVKVTVTQPHGELLRITNGVPKPLGIGADEVSSPSPAPSASAVPAQTAPPQPGGGSSTDKRSLRSHDGGSRLKSDLAIYFSNYDDIIAGVEKTPDFFDINAPIYLVDEPTKSPKPTEEPSFPEAARKTASPSRSRTFQEIDYSRITNIVRASTDEDPLADSVYFAQHRRAERKEKQLRNIEKERAMHEKVQLERLLDGLQGPDWLKVMGITGVTDGERKEWEPKRDYFVKEVEALVDKFRLWKEQEKRVKADKEAALAKEESDEDESDSESEHRKTNGKQPAASPHAKAPSPPKSRRPPRPHGFVLPIPIVPEPTTPFVSFYSKPHLRAAALGKHRHGRNASAFGQSIPEWESHDFELPEDFVTPEFLRDNARKRRRRKRESGATTTQ
ncbi:hypothetical protein P280DRAFT_493962 [Massarina eburnea CBS 473.64]|uniref:Something about silencing protein 4 domain-containing protein n=1 Tax=Massarina eburnea CBS 473.64 TaxID=1395130 RepID=A0A6A6RHY7_9PLEO|nr:hypothetical protein P280DRAFT_493962 [Massarina eburnea CBS 473.64]